MININKINSVRSMEQCRYLVQLVYYGVKSVLLINSLYAKNSVRWDMVGGLITYLSMLKTQFTMSP